MPLNNLHEDIGRKNIFSPINTLKLLSIHSLSTKHRETPLHAILKSTAFTVFLMSCKMAWSAVSRTIDTEMCEVA